MRNSFAYSLPVKIVFGVGVAEQLKDIATSCGFKRGVLIADKLFAENGMADKIMKDCPSLVALYSDITPNPMLSEVTAAAELLRQTEADYAVALGGGSSMDLAKFACSLVFADSTATDYFYKRKVFGAKHLPLVVLPTTAGTGSEVTSVSVCNDDQTGIKSPLPCDNFYPYLAVVDPLLTLSVPPFVTATTGIDAMSHALEAFWSVNHQPVCDMYAEKSLELIFSHLEKAYLCGEDIEARSAMSLGALYAGLAFALPKTAAVHACSYPLSIRYHLNHGEACAFTLDMFLRENASVDGRLHTLAQKLGFRGVGAMADKIKDFKEKFGFKTTLKALGCEDVAALAAECQSHPLFQNNPKKFTAKSLAEVFCYYG
ncbi:MAG: iron-containing alcohol dehydrogenase [Clostridia bacterium]|nr:iron-containing alcohol dehydrogenase [Clostridia bacterium]